MWVILTPRERQASCKREGLFSVTVRSCVDNIYGGGTKGHSDRRRCANRNTCSEVFGCATEVEDECTGDHARVTEARHGYVRLLWRLEGAICYVRCGAPVCCGAKKVSLGPSGYLSFFTCNRRQHAAASLPLANIPWQQEQRDRWFKPDEDRSGKLRSRSINGRTCGGDATCGWHKEHVGEGEERPEGD